MLYTGLHLRVILLDGSAVGRCDRQSLQWLGGVRLGTMRSTSRGLQMFVTRRSLFYTVSGLHVL